MTVTERLGFAIAVFGQNLVYNWFTLFLLVYFVEGVGISKEGIVTLTIILTVVRVWDAVNDIVIGLLVDRTRTRWGTFRPYILLTALPIGLLTWGIYSIPDTSETTQLVLIGVAYVLWDIVYTASDVPLWSLTSVITTDEVNRARLISWARTAAMIALALITLAGAPLAVALSEGDDATASGWSRAALVVSAVGMALFTLAFFATREKVAHRPDPLPFGAAVRQLASNTPLFVVLLSGVLAFGQLLVQVGGAVVATVIFGDVEVFTTLGGALIGGIIAGAVLAPVVLRRTTRRNALMGCLLGVAITYLALLVVGYGSLVPVAAAFFVNGLFTGVYTVAQTMIIADTADWAEVRTGERVDGSCFAGLTFTTKLGSAIATLVFGLAVAWVGYEKGVTVTDGMRDGLWLAVTLVAVASSLLAMFPLRWYTVPERDLPRLLAERRAG